MKIATASVVNAYLTVPSSARSPQNIHPHSQLQSSTSSNLGFLSPQSSMTDGAGNSSSANWTVPKTKDTFKDIRKRWTSRILQFNLHLKFTQACFNHQADPFIDDNDVVPFFPDLQQCFHDHKDPTILPFQPFRLHLLHQLLVLSEDPDPNIALLLKEGIPSGAFSPLQPVGLWEPNPKPNDDEPDLQICLNNWSSANTDPGITCSLTQQEIDNNLVEEIQDIETAERRWPKGPKALLWESLVCLGVVCADNRGPGLVLDSQFMV